MSSSLMPLAIPRHVMLGQVGLYNWAYYAAGGGYPDADSNTVFNVDPNNTLEGIAYLLTHPQGGKSLFFVQELCIPVEFDANFGVWKKIK